MAQSNLAFADTLLCDESYAYHDLTRSGFVSLLSKEPGARQPKTHTVTIAQLPKALAAVDAAHDVWLTQNEFSRPSRRIVDLVRICACYVDIDTYKEPILASMSAERLGSYVSQVISERSLPAPSIVVFSGRGLQLKWILERPIPKDALPRWKAVQEELCRRLSDLGADKAALDASRVLRVVGTVNTRSGERVRVLDTLQLVAGGATPLSNGYLGYNFETLALEVLPRAREKLELLSGQRAQQQIASERTKAARRAQMGLIQGGKGKGVGRALVPSVLAWHRLCDLERLVDLRGWGEGVPSGHRDTFLFLGACFLAQSKIVPHLYPEIVSLANTYVPAWGESEIQSCVSSVLTRAKAAMQGERIEFDGKTCDPRYVFRNQTLIDLLEISSDEQTQLKTIIDSSESKRRDALWHREKRREQGVKSRQQLDAERESKRKTARNLRAQGWSRERLAEELGVSLRTIDNYLKS